MYCNRTIYQFSNPPRILYNNLILIVFTTCIALIIALPPDISEEDVIDTEDPKISDLLVSHYDCRSQLNLRRFSLTRVDDCKNTPSQVEHTRVLASIYVRAKATRVTAWVCEAYVARRNFICGQMEHDYRRYDREDYYVNGLKRPLVLNPTECKLQIRFLNGTSNPELNLYNHSQSFTYFDDFNYQNAVEAAQGPFRVTKIGTSQYGRYTYHRSNEKWIPDKDYNPYSKCPGGNEQRIQVDDWHVNIREVTLTYDDKQNKMIYNGHILPCTHADGFC